MTMVELLNVGLTLLKMSPSIDTITTIFLNMTDLSYIYFLLTLVQRMNNDFILRLDKRRDHVLQGMHLLDSLQRERLYSLQREKLSYWNSSHRDVNKTINLSPMKRVWSENLFNLRISDKYLQRKYKISYKKLIFKHIIEVGKPQKKLCF